jgi:hypothetical protein
MPPKKDSKRCFTIKFNRCTKIQKVENSVSGTITTCHISKTGHSVNTVIRSLPQSNPRYPPLAPIALEPPCKKTPALNQESDEQEDKDKEGEEGEDDQRKMQTRTQVHYDCFNYILTINTLFLDQKSNRHLHGY